MSAKLLMITENTIIKLYEKFLWEGYSEREICVLVVDDIIAKLSKSSKPHPLKELFLSKTDKGPFYELIHFVFSTVENYVKMKEKHLKKD